MLDQLIGMFFESPFELGEFALVPADKIPQPQRSLLDHNLHMTVAVEKFHQSTVDVEVLRHRLDDHVYCREICLRRTSDGQTVQYGIVRLDFRYLDDSARSEIETRETPLGRILIDHEVLRRVELLDLYKITAGERLASLLQVPVGEACYGRTAIIHCNGAPAIELLEIVNT